MKELYIHIGQPKTGTSALQAFLAINREILRDKGLYYPMLESELAIREKNSALGGNAIHGLRIFGCPAADIGSMQIKYIERIRKLFDQDDRILLSDEGLWEDSPVIFENMKALLGDELSIDIKIIVYLRRQDERIESEWNQIVQTQAYTGTCIEFAENKDIWDYYLKLHAIEKAVGKENMIIKLYESENFSAEDSIFKDFLSIFEIKDMEAFKMLEYQVNPPLSRNMVEMKRILNFIPSVVLLDDEIRKILNERTVFARNTEAIVKAPAILSYQERKEILDRCREGNEKIGQEYFGIHCSPFQKIEEEYENCPGGGIYQETIYFLGRLLVGQAKEIEKLHWEIDEFKLPAYVKKGSRILVYGADKRGRRVYHWLKKTGDYYAAGLIDSRFGKIKSIEEDVQPPVMLFEIEFDYILIGVSPLDSAQKIRDYLEMRGFRAEQIIRV